jgi:hypothetical protein
MGLIDRESWFPHSGGGGAPRDLHGQLHVCCVKKPIKGRSWKLEASLQRSKTGTTGAHSPAPIEVRVYLGPWVLPSCLPL